MHRGSGRCSPLRRLQYERHRLESGRTRLPAAFHSGQIHLRGALEFTSASFTAKTRRHEESQKKCLLLPSWRFFAPSGLCGERKRLPGAHCCSFSAISPMCSTQLFEAADERGCTPMFGAAHRRESACIGGSLPSAYEVA